MNRRRFLGSLAAAFGASVLKIPKALTPAPKVDAAKVLREAMRPLPDDFFMNSPLLVYLSEMAKCQHPDPRINGGVFLSEPLVYQASKTEFHCS